MRQTIIKVLFAGLGLFLSGFQSGSLWVPAPAEGISPLDELPVWAGEY